jgi:hypothetical protein
MIGAEFDREDLLLDPRNCDRRELELLDARTDFRTRLNLVMNAKKKN